MISISRLYSQHAHTHLWPVVKHQQFIFVPVKALQMSFFREFLSELKDTVSVFVFEICRH